MSRAEVFLEIPMLETALETGLVVRLGGYRQRPAYALINLVNLRSQLEFLYPRFVFGSSHPKGRESFRRLGVGCYATLG
jgi:hypothetical protein